MKQVNKKGLTARLMIATFTVSMLSMFISPAWAISWFEWTSNSSLVKSQDKWDCRLWHWAPGFLEPASPDANNYCNWTADGTVNLRVKDSCYDTYFTAANLDQGTERLSLPASYQPPLLNLTSVDSVILKADIENCHGSSLVVLPDFIGIKFDAWAVVDQAEGSVKLMAELYFLRAGFNLAWTREYARKTDPNSDVWNYLVALDHPDFYGIYANETKYGTDSAKWSIDLKYFIKRGADAHNIDFNKLYLSKVSFTLEAGGYLKYNACWGTIHMLKVIYGLNSPPNTPSTPSGPTSGLSTWKSYIYYTSATDPDGDDLYYLFDWGDGKTGGAYWVDSGETTWSAHAWTSKGTYYVKVKVQDTNGAWSNWSPSLKVEIVSEGNPPMCPTLFSWSGTAYVEEGVLDIHAESDLTVQHEIQNTLTLENGVYKLQLRELDNYTSHIDQVKLYAVDHKGKLYLCPLTYAYHNELGNVKQTLLFDDDIRVDLEPTEIIDLKFAPSIPYSQTAHFIFEINGYNMK